MPEPELTEYELDAYERAADTAQREGRMVQCGPCEVRELVAEIRRLREAAGAQPEPAEQPKLTEAQRDELGQLAVLPRMPPVGEGA